MLPKVTLLKNYTSYHYIYGNGSYEFKGGIPKSVPVAVALILKKKVNDNNEPLFKVDNLPIVIKNKSEQNKKVAIIGAGPSGLSCAYYLAIAGFEVNVYETKKESGGMVSAAIPSFRLTGEDYAIDLERIQKMGVSIHYNKEIDKNRFEELQHSNDFIFIKIVTRF